MLAFKTVQQNYQPTDVTLRLLDEFRSMVNDCLRIGLQENVTSLKALSLRAYRHLARYDALSYYRLCAISGLHRNRPKSRQRNHSRHSWRNNWL